MAQETNGMDRRAALTRLAAIAAAGASSALTAAETAPAKPTAKAGTGRIKQSL